MGLAILVPNTGAGPTYLATTTTAPYHGTQNVTLSSYLRGCGNLSVSHAVPFSFTRGFGGSANVSAGSTSCLAAPSGGMGVEIFYDSVFLKVHGLGGTHNVYANFSLTGLGGVVLHPGKCTKGNASSWTCTDIAQSALDLVVYLHDYTNGSLWIPLHPVVGQVGRGLQNSTSCTLTGGCGYKTMYQVCRIPGGCVYVGGRSFTPVWSGTTVASEMFNVVGMNPNHLYEIEIGVSEWAFNGCQNHNAHQTGCHASSWVAPGPKATGLNVTSLTVQ